MDISISYYSSVGGRIENEDTVYINESDKGITAIVADGVGGHEDGKRASEIAVKEVSAELISGEKTTESVKNAIYKANEEILRQQKGNNMSTTLALIYIEKLKAIAAHVGDSRIYQFRKGNIIYQSSDHSVAQTAVNAGEIKQSELRGHEDRNKLLRVLGSREKHEPYLKELDLEDKDAFLVCSDGFWELILENEMIMCLEKSHNAGEWLDFMKKCIEERITHKSDNNTAVAIILDLKSTSA